MKRIKDITCRIRLGAERGFTLLEILISMAILSFGLLGIAGLATTSIQVSAHARALTQATNLARDRAESLLSVDYDNLYLSDSTTGRTDLRRTCSQTDNTAARPVYTCVPTTTTITVDNAIYTWGYTVTHIDLDGSGAINVRKDKLSRIDVTVSWPDAVFHTTKSVTLASSIALE
ncbi:MAG: type IV pilus modification protein PilV [Thermodesulfobacteriota bacterium]